MNRSGFKEGSVVGRFSVLNVENGLVLAKWEAIQEGLAIGQAGAEKAEPMRAASRANETLG